MCTLMLCVATAALGIDVGWQRLPEGGMEYIIQLDPQTLEVLRKGEPIQSDIPRTAGEVRSYRIIVGAKKQPRETPSTPPSIPKTAGPESPYLKQPRSVEPQTLAPNLGVKPLAERPALFMEPEIAPSAGKPQPKPTPEAPPDKPGKPWLPLTFTLFALFGSLGANAYLGWIAWDARRLLEAAKLDK